MDKNLIFPKYHVLTNNCNDMGLSERNYKQCNSIQVDQERKKIISGMLIFLSKKAYFVRFL